MLITKQSTIDGIAILAVDSVRIDSRFADAFKNECLTYFSGHSGLVIDLGKVQFFDSIGLGALLFLLRKATQNDLSLVYCTLTPVVSALVSRVGMDKVLRLANDREEAIRGMKKDAPR